MERDPLSHWPSVEDNAVEFMSLPDRVRVTGESGVVVLRIEIAWPLWYAIFHGGILLLDLRFSSLAGSDTEVNRLQMRVEMPVAVVDRARSDSFTSSIEIALVFFIWICSLDSMLASWTTIGT